MRVKQITTASVAIFFATCALTSQAEHQPGHNEPGHNWVSKQPQNVYWQAPTWTMPPAQNTTRPAPASPPPPAYNNRNQAPPAPVYRQPYQGNYPQNQNRYRTPPPQYMNRGYPPPRGPYGADRGASGYNTPGFNPNRRNNNRWSNNKFWGRSGPSKWMNPSKENWENSWDDMINSPSRMGEMPGGWTAPEVTMPNPIDMGDQFQDNIQELPDQMRQGQIGNNVTN